MSDSFCLGIFYGMFFGLILSPVQLFWVSNQGVPCKRDGWAERQERSWAPAVL
jgi:hypothetical protein